MSSTQKQILVRGLGVFIGECLLGLNGPFFFQRFGLNMPAAAAAGAAAGAVLGYLIADRSLNYLATRQPVSEVPEITKPEVAAGFDDLRTGGAYGTIEANSTRERIEAALSRLPDSEADDIRVEVRDGKVVLRGKVHTWPAEATAEEIAFNMPGIQKVENRLEVVPHS